MRNIKPRTRGDYDNKKDSIIFGGGAPPDDRTINPKGPKVSLMRPSYDKGPLIVRPCPALSWNAPGRLIVPGRESVDPRGVSHWYTTAPAVKYIGMPKCPKFSFILYGAWQVREDPEIRRNNPYKIFYYACKNACKAGRFGSGVRWDSDWNQLLDGEKGDPIAAPKGIAVFTGFVYANGDKEYVAGDRSTPLGLAASDLPQITQLSSDSGEKLMNLLDREADAKLLEKRYPNGFDREAEPWKAFAFGDPTGVPQNVGDADEEKTISVDGGLIFVFFNPKKSKVVKDSKGVEFVRPIGSDLTIPLSRTSWDGKPPKWGGYEVGIIRSYTASDKTEFPAALDPAQTAEAMNKYNFYWDDDNGEPGVLHIPSNEEQMLMIAKAFADAPKLVEFAFADHEEYLSGEVMAVLRKKRVAAVPGTDEERAVDAGVAGPEDFVEEGAEAAAETPAEDFVDEAQEELATEEAADVDATQEELDTAAGDAAVGDAAAEEDFEDDADFSVPTNETAAETPEEETQEFDEVGVEGEPGELAADAGEFVDEEPEAAVAAKETASRAAAAAARARSAKRTNPAPVAAPKPAAAKSVVTAKPVAAKPVAAKLMTAKPVAAKPTVKPVAKKH